MATATILVVEDDDAIRRGLVDALSFGGFEVIECATGGPGLTAALGADLDLILLDVVLPDVDGLTILQQVRKARPALPVILVTARGAEDDRVEGLRRGADDYVVKPFSARELLARVDAVLRRSPSRPVPVETIEFVGRTVELQNRRVLFADGSERDLSEKEAGILKHLATCSGRPVSRDELLQAVWGLDPRGITTRTVDMHIARLREKLDDDKSTGLISTVRNHGYRLCDSAELLVQPQNALHSGAPTGSPSDETGR